MQSPRVSIIVPIYNVEPYLAQCLDSLLVQELKELEIILVNDGSTDGTPHVASRYAEGNGHVLLISQENQGLSAARNAGMRAAQGEYFGFVDGDDWVHASMYREMYEKAVETRADLVITNGYLCNDVTKDLRPIQDFQIWASFKTRNCDVSIDPRLEPDLFILDTSACKRLYRRQYLERLNFKFPRGKIFEDVPAHYKLLLNTDMVALLDKPFYYYRTHRPGRITAKKDATLFQVFDVMKEVLEDLRENEANDVIWANFIWFQNWVLRWLKDQVDSAYSEAFERRSFEISNRFKHSAVEVFNMKFSNDQAAIAFVKQQMQNALSQTA